MKIKQNGFATFVSIILVLYILVLGAGGYLIWNNLHNKDETSSVTNFDDCTKAEGSIVQESFPEVCVTKAGQRFVQSAPVSYTDSAGVFSLTYPQDWKLNYVDAAGGEGNKPTPDYSKVSRPFALLPPHRQSNEVLVRVGSGDAIKENAAKTDKFHTVQKLTINGQEAVYDKLVYTGPSAAEKYTDHTYIIVSEDKSVTLTFRESYYHNYPPENWSDSQDLAGFESIVNSIRIKTSSATQSDEAGAFSTTLSKVPTGLQRAIKAEISKETPACIKDDQLVDFNGKPIDADVNYAPAGAATTRIGCDDGAAGLFAKNPQGEWKFLAKTQMAFDCDLLLQYDVPKILLDLSTPDNVQCFDKDNNLVSYH